MTDTRQVVLVTGPPGAGKSTRAAAIGLPHLEREQFPSDAAFRTAVQDATAPPLARVAVVRCCPSPAEEREWAQMIGATDTVTVTAPLDECLRRIEQRRRPRWSEEQDAARRWFSTRDGRVPAMGDTAMSETGTAGAEQGAGGTMTPEPTPPPEPTGTDWEAEAKRLKALNRKVEDQNKANLKRLEQLEQAALSDQEKAVAAAVNAARDEARQETLRQVGHRLVDAEVKAAAAGRVNVDALLEGLDRTRFLGDDLEPDSDRIASWVDSIAPTKDAAGFDIGQGARGNGATDRDLTGGSDFERALVEKVGGMHKR